MVDGTVEFTMSLAFKNFKNVSLQYRSPLPFGKWYFVHLVVPTVAVRNI